MARDSLAQVASRFRRRTEAQLGVFKAEMVLAAQVSLRHRSPRIAIACAATVIVIAVLAREPGRALGVEAGAVSAVAAILGSRVLARGGPVECAAFVSGSVQRLVWGRFAGLVPVVMTAAWAANVLAGHAPFGRTFVLNSMCALAVGATTMALTPLLRASGAAAMGVVFAVGGSSPVEAARAMFSDHGDAMATLWLLLPLPWRVSTGQSDSLFATSASLYGLWLIASVSGAGLALYLHKGD